jgi:hypothetical protein
MRKQVDLIASAAAHKLNTVVQLLVLELLDAKG